MATKSQIIVDSNNTYVPNTSGLITPQQVQQLNTAWISSSTFPEDLPNASVRYAETASLLLGTVSSASFAVTASYAFSASNATSASYAYTASSAFKSTTSSLATTNIQTASINLNTITFTKGDGSQFSLSIAVSGSVASASYANTAGTANTAISSSYASNAELLDGLDYTAFASTGSFNALSSSYTALSSSYNTFSGSASTRITANSASISAISSSLLQVSSSTQQVSASYIALSASYNTFSGSASTRLTSNSASISALNTATASYAVLSANQTFSGVNTFSSNITASNIKITGTASIAFLDVTFQSSSVIYSSGSNQLGDAANDTQTLWGTVNVVSGPLVATGSVNVSGSITVYDANNSVITHHLKAPAVNGVEILNNGGNVVALFGAGGSQGTTFNGQVNATAFSGSGASVYGVVSSSYAYTASSAVNSLSASFATLASTAINATSASFASTAGTANNADKIAVNNIHSPTGFGQRQYPLIVNNASGYKSASIETDVYFDSPVAPFISVMNVTASFANNAATSSLAGSSLSASFSTSASFAISASVAISSSFALSASIATTASYALNAGSDFPFSGSAVITGSLTISGSTNISSGSIILYSQKVANNKSFEACVTQSENALNNIISVNHTSATSTGSFIVSGSGNIISTTSFLANVFANQGATSAFGGTNSYITVLPLVSGSNPNFSSAIGRRGPNFANSNVNSTITVNDNRLTETSTPVVFNSSNLLMTATANIQSGSLTINNSQLLGSGTTFVLSGSGTQAGNATLAANIIATAATTTITFNATSSGTATLSSNIIVGSNIKLSLTGSTPLNSTVSSTPSLLDSAIIGRHLVVTGSSNSNSTTANIAVFGQNNTADGLLNDGRFTKFAIGTGASDASRSTAFHVSASGMTTANIGLNVRGTETGETELEVRATGVKIGNLLADAHNLTGSFSITGSQTITGSLVGQPVSQSVSSNTASLNLATGNFFNLTLPASANTYITASGQLPGQTVNIKVTQGATTGSLSFGAGFKQVSGSYYTGSSTANAVDIVTLISFDSTGLYVSNVNNLI